MLRASYKPDYRVYRLDETGLYLPVIVWAFGSHTELSPQPTREAAIDALRAHLAPFGHRI